MVVLSVAIVTKTGRLLLSRQFMDMTRIRVEGLMAAFPKLLVSASTKQHTYFETNEVRYVYQPLENMYLVLLTTKSSNIVEDLETLRLLSKVVPDTCLSGNVWLNEEVIGQNAFELIFAIDEVVTFGGHRIQITLHQIRKNLLMESQQEMAYEEALAAKEDDAREESRRKAETIKQRKLDAMVRNQGRSSPMKGFGGGFGNSNSSDGFGKESSSINRQVIPNYPSRSQAFESDDEEEYKPRKSRKGLSLGKKNKKTNSALKALAAEEGINLDQSKPMRGRGSVKKEQIIVENVNKGDVEISVHEKIRVACNRDGGLESLEIKGSLTVTAHTEAGQLSQVKLVKGDNDNFQVQSNPHIDRKALASEHILRSKSTSRPFPLGNGVGAMRWRFSSNNDDSYMPLIINCWPEAGDSTTSVNIEYTLELTSLTLRNLVITIPLGTSATPQFSSVSGSTKHDKREGVLYWIIDEVDAENDSGSIEFTIEGTDEDSFFPLDVSFESPQTFFKISPSKGISSEKKPIEITSNMHLSVDSFSVG